MHPAEEVAQTAGLNCLFFVLAVASTARVKESSLSAAVESTDRNLAYLERPVYHSLGQGAFGLLRTRAEKPRMS